LQIARWINAVDEHSFLRSVCQITPVREATAPLLHSANQLPVWGWSHYPQL